MSLRNENSQADQTEFIEQVPFFDHQSSKLFSWQEIKKNKSLRPFYILVLVFVSLTAISILGLMLKRAPEPEVNREIVRENIQSNPLVQRALQLREDLKAHDPTKQSLPFPQVDLEFNIN